MNFLFKDLFGLVGIVQDVYDRIRKILVPPKAYSWQTLIYLSVYSWILSFFAIGYIQNIIAFFGWLFLIAGTAWYTTDDPLRVPGTFMPVGAVITGFLVSVFAFGNQDNGITSRTIVLWPTISALITAIPEFFEGSGTDSKAQIPKPEVRQRITVLVASSMVLSCWIQFYFVMDTWLKEYPSLLADDFQRSTFVVRMDKAEKIPENGVLILDRLQPIVEAELAGKPWSQVERWLLDAKTQVGNLGNQVINKTLAEYEEKELWRIEPRVVNTKSGGYILDLLSIWEGPSSNSKGYYLKKSCRIEPVAGSINNPSTTVNLSDNKSAVAEIECDRLSKFIAGAPPPQQ
ncbi:septal junction protein FraD [Halotia branconii]|uniref:Septal junction protein FraD n=1 Tax=Halotia branconii CENA392 TaxID=1539056 RepID=A0AAJ6P8A0_9CYAN|nr:septal junction protein FraD [Halotia branconii]WGV24569.1 septal junction protein FraD [Halotia branconii CENA392]